MNLCKRILKSKGATVFLVTAFTISILIFIVAMTIFNNKKEILKKYSIENNKEMTFISKEEVDYREIQKLLSKEDVSIEIQFYDEESKAIISTELVMNALSKLENISRKIGSDDFDMKENTDEVIISSMLKGENEFIVMNGFDDGEKKLRIKGVFDDLERNIIISNKLFFEKVGVENIGFGFFRIFIRGEKNNIEKSVEILKKNITNTEIEIFDYMKEDRNEEIKTFLKATGIIIIITIINSIGITAFWINSRRKELAIRKALGGRNRDLQVLYLKELILIGILSMVISFVSYIFISKFYDGYMYGFSLEFNIITFIQAMGLVLIVAFFISVPSLIYLSNLNVTEVLRGE